MKKSFKKIMSVILSTVICYSVITYTVSADECFTTDEVDYYVQKLEHFNEKYAAHFALDVDNKSESELNDIVSFYSEMTDEEFEEYFLNLKNEYEEWELNNDNGDIEIVIDNAGTNANSSIPYNADSIQSSPSVSETQYYFYNASHNANSLVLYSTVNYSAGWGVYMSIDGIDAYVSEFPALIADRYSKTINSYNGGCTVTCNYYCKTYVNFSAYVLNSDVTVIVTFLAGGGDIYAYTTV